MSAIFWAGVSDRCSACQRALASQRCRASSLIGRIVSQDPQGASRPEGLRPWCTCRADPIGARAQNARSSQRDRELSATIIFATAPRPAGTPRSRRARASPRRSSRPQPRGDAGATQSRLDEAEASPTLEGVMARPRSPVAVQQHPRRRYAAGVARRRSRAAADARTARMTVVRKGLEVGQGLGLAHAGGELLEDILDRGARAGNTGLAAADPGGDSDAIPPSA